MQTSNTAVANAGSQPLTQTARNQGATNMTKTNTAAKTTTPAAATKTAATLTGNEAKVLGVLAKNSKPLTRKDLAAKTGINKGWSKMLGSATKADGGMSGKDSLEGRGLIKCEQHEGERALQYTITAKGKAELAKNK